MRTLIHFVSSNAWGGPERYALDICRHYKACGWRVLAVTRDVHDLDSRFAAAHIPLRHAPLRDYPDIFSGLFLRHTLRKIPQGEGIIHVHNFRDAMTALLARTIARRPDIRVVVTCHEARRADKAWSLRWVYGDIDRLIFVSDFAKSRFLSSWPDGQPPIEAEKTGVAYNSLYIPEVADGALPALPEPERGPVTAMYRGKLKPGKGLEALIDALSLLKDLKLRLRIVGDGDPDYVDAIRRRAVTRGVMERIDWVRRGADDPTALIRESHFGVFPSVEPEAFGMTNLEMMAAGRAQISTMTGGQKEFLHNEVEALEVIPADAQSLSLAMRRLATDPDLRQRLGTAAREAFKKRFSWNIFISRLDTAYLS